MLPQTYLISFLIIKIDKLGKIDYLVPLKSSKIANKHKIVMQLHNLLHHGICIMFMR